MYNCTHVAMDAMTNYSIFSPSPPLPLLLLTTSTAPLIHLCKQIVALWGIYITHMQAVSTHVHTQI